MSKSRAGYAGIYAYNDPRMGGAGAKEFFKKVGNWFKNSHVISKGLAAIGSALPPQYGAIAGTASNIAANLGLGRRRRRVVRRPAGGSKSARKRGGSIANGTGSGSIMGIQKGINGGRRKRRSRR